MALPKTIQFTIIRGIYIPKLEEMLGKLFFRVISNVVTRVEIINI